MTEHPDITLVRQWWDACMAGRLEDAGAMVTSDVVHHVPGTHPLAGHYKGREAVFDLYRRYGEEIDDVRSEMTTVLTDGRGHVISEHHNTYQRKGRTLRAREAILFTIVGDKINDIEEFTDDLDAVNEFWS